jgi:hypothetical protein
MRKKKMKRTTTEKNFKKGNIEIYRRILKYSPFALKRKKGIHQSIHKLENGGTVKISAVESITVADAGKLYALLHCLQSGTAKTVKSDETTTVIECKLSEIRKVLNENDYINIVKSLKRIAHMTIDYNFANNDSITTHILHEGKTSEKKDMIIATFNTDFLWACKEKSLTLHFPTYQALSPSGKNLYSFLISNSGNVFSEEILLERCGINTGRKDKMQYTLKKAMHELVDRAIIAGYDIRKKDGKRMYHIQRIRETTDAEST